MGAGGGNVRRGGLPGRGRNSCKGLRPEPGVFIVLQAVGSDSL